MKTILCLIFAAYLLACVYSALIANKDGYLPSSPTDGNVVGAVTDMMKTSPSDFGRSPRRNPLIEEVSKRMLREAAVISMALITAADMSHRHQVVVGNNLSSYSTLNSNEQSENVPSLDHSWECGTDEFSKYIAESTIERDCPFLKTIYTNMLDLINHCCIGHDKCYDDQLGKKHCDDVFCDCLLESTQDSQTCHEDSGPTFCLLVREFGDEAYQLSGVNRTAAVEP